jgi:hypothetical protein
MVEPPDLRAEGYQLLGTRLGYFLDRMVAEIGYEGHQHRLSIFMTKGDGIDRLFGERVSRHGQEFFLTTTKGYTVVAWPGKATPTHLVRKEAHQCNACRFRASPASRACFAGAKLFPTSMRKSKRRSASREFERSAYHDRWTSISSRGSRHACWHETSNPLHQCGIPLSHGGMALLWACTRH